MTSTDRKQRPRPLSALFCFSALTIAQSGLGLLLLPLYVKYIPPQDYGVLAAVTIVAGLVGAASNLKLDAAMRTFYFDYSGHPEALEAYLRQTFSTSAYFAAAVYVLMLLIGDGVFGLIFRHGDIEFFPAGAIALATAGVTACLSCYFVYLRNSLRLRELVLWQSAIVSGTVALQIFFVVVLQLGLYGVLWGSLVPTATTMLAIAVSRPGLLGARPSARQLLPSLAYSLPLVALGLCYALGTRLDRLVLEHYVDLDELGAYAVLASLLALLGMALNALDNAIRPYLYPAMRSTGHPPDATALAYQRLYGLIGVLALSAAVFVGGNLRFFTSDPKYLLAQQWLLFGATAFAPIILTRYYALLFDFHKRSVGMTVAVVLRVAALCTLLIVLVPRFAIVGALLAIMVSETLNALAFALAAKRSFGAATPLRTIGAQIATFVGTLWLLAYAAAGTSPAAFGALQLTVVAGLLLAANRHALRTLLVRPEAPNSAIARNRG